MSVRFHRWFGVQPELLEKGTVKKLSDSDLRLYLYLCWMSDRKTSRQFKVVAKDVVEWTGMSLRSISTARHHLVKFGMVCCDALPGGGFTYTLCDLRTGKPYPGHPKEKIVTTPKDKHAASAKDKDFSWQPKDSSGVGDNDQNISARRAEAAAPGKDYDDTSFNHGYNVADNEPRVSVSDYNPFSDPNPFSSY